MGKRILIGSMLVLTLLLLMPSIPAIQQKTIEDGIKQDLQEKLDTITLDDFKDIDVLDGIKHPILYDLVMAILVIRMYRCSFLFDISAEIVWPGAINVKRPILFMWFFVAFCRMLVWDNIWSEISNRFGWGWNYYNP